MRRATQQLLLVLLVIAPFTSFAGNGRTERLLAEVGQGGRLRIVAVVTPAEDGPKAAIKFDLDEAHVQIIANRKLASIDDARRVADTARVDTCGMEGDRVVFRVSMAGVFSLYYVADVKNKRWGEFPITVETCPAATMDPPKWNPSLKKAP